MPTAPRPTAAQIRATLITLIARERRIDAAVDQTDDLRRRHRLLLLQQAILLRMIYWAQVEPAA